MNIKTFSLAVICGLTTTAYAQSLPIDHDANLRLGVNATYNATAYHAKDPVFIMPQAFYDNNRWYIEGAEAGFYPYKDNKHHVRIGLTYDGQSFDPNHANAIELKQLNKRQWSALAHASYLYITPYGGLKAKAATDVLDRHDGQTVTLSHLSRFNKDAWTVYPEFGATWHSKDYNQYYYGILDAEALKTNHTAYQADSGWSPFVTATVNYQVTPKVSAFVNQRIEWLSNAQKNSPMTDNKIDSKTRLGLNYHF